MRDPYTFPIDQKIGCGYGWGMGPWMMDWGFGMGWLGMILTVAFWILVIIGIVSLVKWLLVFTRGAHAHKDSSQDSPLEILKRRYAGGEITKEEFEEKKKDLGY